MNSLQELMTIEQNISIKEIITFLMKLINGYRISMYYMVSSIESRKRKNLDL